MKVNNSLPTPRFEPGFVVDCRLSVGFMQRQGPTPQGRRDLLSLAARG